MFIELTQKDSNNSLLINLQDVSRIEQPTHTKKQSIIRFRDGKYQFVTEDYDKVKQMIRTEIAADRGY